MLAVLGCLGRNYHRFVPGALVTVIAIFALDTPIAAFVIWTQASACHLAAASRSLGLLRESVLSQVFGRGTHHLLLCLMLGLVLGAAAFVAFVAAGLWSPAWLPWRTTGWIAFGILALVILARAWPVYPASFVFQGDESFLRALIRSGLGFHGPGFVSAWRMTRRFGAFLRFTLPLLLAWLVLGGAALAAGVTSDGGAFMILVVVWAFLVSPLLHLDTVATAERLRATSGEPSGRVVSSAP